MLANAALRAIEQRFQTRKLLREARSFLKKKNQKTFLPRVFRLKK